MHSYFFSTLTSPLKHKHFSRITPPCGRLFSGKKKSVQFLHCVNNFQIFVFILSALTLQNDFDVSSTVNHFPLNLSATSGKCVAVAVSVRVVKGYSHSNFGSFLSAC